MTVLTAADIESSELSRFLRNHYRGRKVDFLDEHARWWYKGQGNRWVVKRDSKIQAYCAVIPSTVLLQGRTVDAVWWVDLVVDTDFRGQGIERRFDRRVQNAAPLILGFPNALAAKIHRRHGWGVRENLETRLLPIFPIKIGRARRAGHFVSLVQKIGGVAIEPVCRNIRRRLEVHQPSFSRVLENPDASRMSQVFFDNHPDEVLTTVRNAEYLQWRYLDAPYRDQLIFIAAGKMGRVDSILVLRIFERGGYKVARLLDLFGKTTDRVLMADMIRFATRTAYERGAIQVTALSSDLTRAKILRKMGFVIRSRSRFCWKSGDIGLDKKIATARHDLTLGDSDNDEP